VKKPRLLFVVNVDWFFLSHRLPLARAARDAGFEVVVAAADSGKAEAIRREGLGFVPAPISRKSINPFREVCTLVFLMRLYRRLRPDLVHHVTLKPVLYGSVMARLVGRIAVVNAISGLGYTYSSNKLAGVLRPLVKALYWPALRSPRSRTIFQNHYHRDEFVRMGLVRLEQAKLIRGSGVNCSRFWAAPEPEGAPIVMLPSRMLWDKGVGEFVVAARSVRATHPRVRFALVGASDKGNPAAVPVSRLKSWVREGVVEWWGHQEDMPAVLSRASVVALPTTHPEGVPKVLLEAAASARPIVATDTPGCREIVHDEVNGLLVPPHDVAALVQAIQTLLRSPELREKLGRAGREIAVAEFAEEIVVEQTMSLYQELLSARWPLKARVAS
jgi:glycosyltransferase involved in cell wall biosynthesis